MLMWTFPALLVHCIAACSLQCMALFSARHDSASFICRPYELREPLESAAAQQLLGMSAPNDHKLPPEATYQQPKQTIMQQLDSIGTELTVYKSRNNFWGYTLLGANAENRVQGSVLLRA